MYVEGHHRVWHGHADILMSTNEEQKVPVLTASIVTDTILLSDEDPRPPTTKRAKSSGILFVKNQFCLISTGPMDSLDHHYCVVIIMPPPHPLKMEEHIPLHMLVLNLVQLITPERFVTEALNLAGR